MKDTTDQFEQNQLQITQLTETYFEWLKLFNHFGSAVAIAFSGKFRFFIYLYFNFKFRHRWKSQSYEPQSGFVC